MSTLKADAVTTKSDNTDLTITGGGTGVPNLESGFKVGGTAGVPINNLRVGTDGELITWDASGDPAAVAVGTATHVLTSNGAGAAPTFQAAAAGGVLGQTVVSFTGAVATGTTTAPDGDTIMQNTEGDQYLTLAITPANSSSKLLFSASFQIAFSSSTGDTMFIGLFQDSTANALAVSSISNLQANKNDAITLLHSMAAGTTSTTTFKIRIGSKDAGTMTVNGIGEGRQQGGVFSSGLIIQEILP